MEKAKEQSDRGLLCRLLRPVVRFCLMRGVKLNDVIDCLKETFVTEAKATLQQAGDSASDSKISVMTGVHRRDLAEFRKAQPTARSSQDLITRVMAKWQHARSFTTKDRKPRVLDASGRASEFAKLVASVNGGDLSGYAVMYEMERLGIVERRGSRAKLLWRDFAPAPEQKRGLRMLSDDMNDLYGAVEENIRQTEKIPNLHLKTSFDNIPGSALKEIRQVVLEEGSKFHARIRSFLAGFDRDIAATKIVGSDRHRVVVGAFSLTEEVIQ